LKKWDELFPCQRRRLQLPRQKLNKEERALRKWLFWNDKWVDSWGHEQKFQAPREKKEVKKNVAKEKSEISNTTRT